MKILRITIFLLAASAGLLYFVFDGSLARYGQNHLPFYTSPPFEVSLEEKEVTRGGGFVLRDAFGFALVDKSVTYRKLNYEISRLEKYGFGEDMVLAEAVDSKGETHFLKFTKKTDSATEPLSVEETDGAGVAGTEFRWVELEGLDLSGRMGMRNLFLGTLSFFLFASLLTLFSKRRS